MGCTTQSRELKDIYDISITVNQSKYIDLFD